MAKGRKLTISRSERYLGSLSYPQETPNAAVVEFGEDDIWAVVDNMDRGGGRSSHATSVTSGHHAGGLSLAFDCFKGDTSAERIINQLPRVTENPHRSHLAFSAPVNVPDWSKIYRVDSGDSLYKPENDGLDESEIVPPHEYLARVNSRNSVFEGVGRTLKGRDMSRVRDAVWSQTGFDG